MTAWWGRALRRAAAWVRDARGQSEWVQQVMVIGIVVLLAAAIFAFWRGGGIAWVQNTLSGITQY
jgi:hypothetical protein